MKYILSIFLFVIITIPVALFLPVVSSKFEPKPVVLISPLASSIKNTAGSSSYKSTGSVQASNILGTADKKVITPINILLLGFDGRRGDSNPRCDAIHMISLDPSAGKIRITTVPRGTTIKLSKNGDETIVTNSCHTMGIDFTVKQIEKITGVHPDAIVKVGFSQTLGALRMIDLPTTPTLQYLRNRRYGIGDYQRSYNQAQFLKDMLVSHFEQLAALPKPIQYLLFQIIDTDMDFEEANQLASQLAASKIFTNPENIELVTKPADNKLRRDISFAESIYGQEADWQNDPEFKTYQGNLEAYLENLIQKTDRLIETKKGKSAYNSIKTPFSQRLWLQLEDEDKRDLLHFEMLKSYIFSSGDKNGSITLLQDFISEMETFEKPELKKQAEELLKEISG